jgi:hypothetical protein
LGSRPVFAKRQRAKKICCPALHEVTALDLATPALAEPNPCSRSKIPAPGAKIPARGRVVPGNSRKGNYIIILNLLKNLPV